MVSRLRLLVKEGGEPGLLRAIAELGAARDRKRFRPRSASRGA